jgi:peptide deformylase
MSSDETKIRERHSSDEPLEARQLEALRQIRTVGDPVLRGHARSVVEFDKDLRRLSKRMLRVMDDARGVGLAAPQIGVARRVIVYDVDEPVTLVNPEIVEASDETVVMDEGCLSVPGVTVPVERALAIRVKGRDLSGHALEYDAVELEARVIQHEMDHLDGVLILERTTREERGRALRALRDGTPGDLQTTL